MGGAGRRVFGRRAFASVEKWPDAMSGAFASSFCFWGGCFRFGCAGAEVAWGVACAFVTWWAVDAGGL